MDDNKLTPEEQASLDAAALEEGAPGSTSKKHPDMGPQLSRTPVLIGVGTVIVILAVVMIGLVNHKSLSTTAAKAPMGITTGIKNHPAAPPMLEKSEQTSGIIPVSPNTISETPLGPVASAGTTSGTAVNDMDQQARMQQDQNRFQLQQLQMQERMQRQQEASQRAQMRAQHMQEVRSADSTVYSANPPQGSSYGNGGNSGAGVINASNPGGDDSPLKGQLTKSAMSAYLPHTRMPAISPYEVKAGAVIPSVMLSGINSDLPGEIIAQVVQNIYDSASGHYLLIPQGAKLVGAYSHEIVLGQQRVLIAWSRIIYPDSSSVEIEGMAGQDQSGYAGFKDRVNHHSFAGVKQALLLSVFSAGAQLSQPRSQRGDYSYSAPQIGAAAMGQQLNQLGMSSYSMRSNQMPTITIRPGYKFNVMVNKDMILAPWQGVGSRTTLVNASL
jgi:type IV secretory pathway VirB10-like protein